ncbi:hypothetical protein [Clostridium weizhouense]|uniref:Uncharacterized protein n=1 Tax=Clostridium weizhouense TaxID=2859781 RepID=A0ABS7ALD7_9CLOT|nr:hypothetical protein [Clostridium weizhouense]MBW6409473.1 hypothetical protein [Clostridium weizhouense]
MATYKPLAVTLGATSISNVNGNKLIKTIGTTAWDLAFIYGTAIGTSLHVSSTGGVYSATVILKSGTVLGWYSTVAGSEGNAAIETFGNSEGRYGVTVNTGAPITLKFYAHG